MTKFDIFPFLLREGYLFRFFLSFVWLSRVSLRAFFCCRVPNAKKNGKTNAFFTKSLDKRECFQVKYSGRKSIFFVR